jgi:hypothetical protein
LWPYQQLGYHGIAFKLTGAHKLCHSAKCAFIRVEIFSKEIHIEFTICVLGFDLLWTFQNIPLA